MSVIRSRLEVEEGVPLEPFDANEGVPANTKTLPRFSSVAELPTRYGQFKVQAVRQPGERTHLIIYKGEIAGREHCPVRIHSECRTGEVFHSLRCDCNEQLALALRRVESIGHGLVIYLRQEGRGIGLFNKIEAYALQDAGLDTLAANHALGLAADARDYTFAVDVLRALDISSVELLTNNPCKIAALERQGIKVRRVAAKVEANPFNDQYLQTKRQAMNHLL